MRIVLTPEDIVKRCLWDSYVYYILGSDKNGEELLKENKEFEITEREAIVIGLLKVIETDNLIYRFNDYLTYFLTIRSTKESNSFYIKKKALEISISKFLNKFPTYWEPDIRYKNSLNDLKKYVGDLTEEISKLDTIELTIQNINYELYSTNAVKKLLNFNNY